MVNQACSKDKLSQLCSTYASTGDVQPTFAVVSLQYRIRCCCQLAAQLQAYIGQNQQHAKNDRIGPATWQHAKDNLPLEQCTWARVSACSGTGSDQPSPPPSHTRSALGRTAAAPGGWRANAIRLRADA